MNHKVLHVCNQDKSIPPFIDFVEEHFGLEDHFFWLIGDYDRYPVRQNKSNYKVNKSIVGQFKGLLKLVHLFHTSEKVVLHGLFNPRIILLLFLMPWVLGNAIGLFGVGICMFISWAKKTGSGS